MASFMTMAANLCRREEAATLVEYTLMMILVAASCVAAVTSFGSAVGSLFQRAVNAFPR